MCSMYYYVVLNRSNPDQLIVSSIDSFLHQEASNFKLESTNQAGGLCRYTERARFCLWNSASSWKNPKEKKPTTIGYLTFWIHEKKTPIIYVKSNIARLSHLFTYYSLYLAGHLDGKTFTEYMEITFLQLFVLFHNKYIVFNFQNTYPPRPFGGLTATVWCGWWSSFFSFF